MLGGLLKKILGDPNEKELKRIQPLVDAINALEGEMKELTDAQLRAKTDEFRARLEEGEETDDLLPEAFAVVREAAQRSTEESFRHYDVQLLGGVVLHEGKIAEMKTGEGKTLVATLPAYLNALEGRGVHIITVNDYLARRDSEWMGSIYEFLGLEVGVILNGMSYEERKKAYQADITYGTNNEFGFDYLRDNMALKPEQVVQGEMHYAILDEVDSILIDEARTPLIISGPTQQSPQLYYRFSRIVPRLKAERDYTVDEKMKSVSLTEEGSARAEKLLKIDNLFDEEHMKLTHHLNQALKAHVMMKRDEDYVVKEGQVQIVDQFTGRIMEGRRYSDGLPQAIEAKEGVKIEKESQTMASITYQNLFRMYDKLAGMTGTAATEEDEFIQIYGLEVVVVPTNKPLIREALPDVIYKSRESKFNAIVDEIEERHQQGQPMLVGTISIEKSEDLSRRLKKRGIPHQVLNAKYHEREAEIIKEAGQRGSVTIATNMAGRGTDIVLGEGVTDLGGLHIIGSERHESRRIDNQLRGRSGRQGDPGSSQFFVSLEDDLMRIFGSDNLSGILEKVGMEEDQPIEHNLISRSIENAQKKVESHHFDVRKTILQYDDVLNKQRQVIYEERNRILYGDNLREQIMRMLRRLLEEVVDVYISQDLHPDEWDLEGLVNYCQGLAVIPEELKAEELRGLKTDEILEELNQRAEERYREREEELGEERMRGLERYLTLRIVDRKWMDHLDGMEDLRQGIGLRAYGQKDPLTEYRIESFDLFEEMKAQLREDLIRYLYQIQVVSEGEREDQREMYLDRKSKATDPFGGQSLDSDGSYQMSDSGGESSETRVKTVVKEEEPGRNDPCPCGSGNKYKRCCGR